MLTDRVQNGVGSKEEAEWRGGVAIERNMKNTHKGRYPYV
jgi:hypothetical protein